MAPSDVGHEAGHRGEYQPTSGGSDSGRSAADSHRAEIRYWGNPDNEQYVVLCHVDGCDFRSRGGLSASEAGDVQMAHWRNPSARGGH